MILRRPTPSRTASRSRKLGLGTWFIDDDDAAQVVRDAAAIGYRHIDTAQAYGNEAGVGGGIRSCGVPREQMFVTTKVAAEAKTFEDAASAIDQSLATTGLDYLDLMIIHSPQPWADFGSDDRYFDGNRDVWRALEQAYTAGRSEPSDSPTSKPWTSTTSWRHAPSTRW